MDKLICTKNQSSQSPQISISTTSEEEVEDFCKRCNESELPENEYIFTFGYGNRKNYDLFLGYLQNYDIKYVIDVRKNPRAWTRRWYGDKIEEFCLSKNIEYISKIDLGNTSGIQKWIPPNLKKAKAALREVAEITQQGTVLLLCAEMNPDKCHRVDVAEKLAKLVSLPVKHLL
ncbi:DUF488 domain-containing protein [filamentous cyanobacterium Phorm 6]|nr:DUF488 domain-containing protein [filamentous cyanobacterium Phorm 6]